VAGEWLIPGWGARGAMYAGLAGVCFQIIALGYLGSKRSYGTMDLQL
jgi:hypothetical protein